MEHFTKNPLSLLIVLIIPAIFLGCRSKDPSPELKDPIYQSLKKEAEEAKKALSEAESTKAQAYTELKSALPQTIELKDAEKEYWKAVKRVDSLRPTVQYLKIRAERRRVEARESYFSAFQQGEEGNWPDPKEFQAYLTNKRLKEASLNWSTRVPKLHERIPSSKQDE